MNCILNLVCSVFDFTGTPNVKISHDDDDGNTPMPDKKQLELILDKLQKYANLISVNFKCVE